LDQMADVGGPFTLLKLFSKYSNLCEKHTWSLTDRQTTYSGTA